MLFSFPVSLDALLFRKMNCLWTQPQEGVLRGYDPARALFTTSTNFRAF